MSRLPRLLCFLSLTALCAAAPAHAQGVMEVAPMPMPPSMRDTPKAQTPAKKTRAPKAATAEDGAPATRPSAGRAARQRGQALRGSGDGRMSDQIDARPARAPSGGALQMEDDPRAVSPVMQNGRPGVGMRF